MDLVIIRYNVDGSLDTTFDQDGVGRLILSQIGSGGVAVLDSDAGVSLDVNFSSGTVEGTLFNGGGFADVDGDGFADDALVVLVTLQNGSISGGTFDGRLRGDAVAFIDDVDFVDLNPTFENTDVDGAFFGNAAGQVAGTYEGDYSSDGPDGSFAGFFAASR